MKRTLLAVGILIFIFFYWRSNRKPIEIVDAPPVAQPKAATLAQRPFQPQTPPPTALVKSEAPALVKPQKPPTLSATKSAHGQDRVLPFVMEDGVAVTQGDLVLGEPVGDLNGESGFARAPNLKLWPTNEIPYYIDPGLTRPERVEQALAMFNGTGVHFVPHTNQKDVLVFQEATGVCKSYVGYIGGAQPVWLPSGCEPKEIAHEVMHALGFVHEQNRGDRDTYINVLNDNIDEKYKDNFDKLPGDWMRVTGLATFDFESLMMYPPWMFAKSGRSTMESKIPDRQIQPGETLSPRDIERINRAYLDPN